MNELDYKNGEFDQSEDKDAQTNVKQTSFDLETSETFGKIGEIVNIFQDSHDLSLIQASISKLKQIIIESKPSALQLINSEQKLSEILMNLLQYDSINYQYKVKIITILQSLLFNEFDEEDEEYTNLIIEFTQQSSFHIIFELLFSIDPTEYKYISDILQFLSKISLQSPESRNALLQLFPNSDIRPPFMQIFDFIQSFDEIPQLQQSFIDFLVSLCYFNMDDDETQQIFANCILPLFEYIEKSDKLFLWDSFLSILHYFVLNHGVFIGSHDTTFYILDFSLQNGTPNTIETSLTIYNIFVDLNVDIHTHLDFSNISCNILNPNQEISESYLKLVEVLINPKPCSKEIMSTDEDQSQVLIPQIQYYLDELIKNGILNSLNEVLVHGIHTHKILSIRIVKRISKIMNVEIIDQILQSTLLSSALDLLESKDFSIARYSLKFLYMFMSKCNEDQRMAIVQNQINEDNMETFAEIVNETQNSEDEDLRNLGNLTESLMKMIEDILKENA